MTHQDTPEGMNDFVYPHRNGETTPPELSPDEFSWYWFDGVAHYEDWKGTGNMIVVTGKHAHRVKGLVIVAMLIDVKHPVRDENGHAICNCATMVAEPETMGYRLDKCEGKWWGPVNLPPLSGDEMFSTAFIEDYEEWKKFHDEARE